MSKILKARKRKEKAVAFAAKMNEIEVRYVTKSFVQTDGREQNSPGEDDFLVWTAWDMTEAFPSRRKDTVRGKEVRKEATV